MDLRFAKWEVSGLELSQARGGETGLDADGPRLQNGKQGEPKNLGQANEAAMAQQAEKPS